MVVAAAWLAWGGAAAAQPLAYITNADDNTVTVLDTATDAVVATIPVGSAPKDPAVSPDGRRLYVIDGFGFTVTVIDTATRRAVATIGVSGGGIGPSGLVVHPDGTRLYVVDFGSDTVSVVDAASHTVIDTILVGSVPTGIALHPAGTRAYVANHESSTLAVLDTATNSVLATIPVQCLPRGVAAHPQGTRVYVPNVESLSVIDAATNRGVTTVPITTNGSSPFGVAIHPTGTRLYTASLGPTGRPGVLSVVDTVENIELTTVEVGAADDVPQGVAAHPDGSRVYVANQRSNSVSVVDVRTNTVRATVPVGAGPSGVAVAPAVVGQPLVPGRSTPATPGPGVARFAITPLDPPGRAADAFRIEITAMDALGNVASGFEGVVTLGAAGGLRRWVSGQRVAPSVSGPFTAGRRTEGVEFLTAGLGQRIRVADGDGHTGVSQPLDVRAGFPFLRRFVVPPRDSAAGRPLLGPPTVALQDNLCNVVTDATGSVTLGLGPWHPEGATLRGTLSRPLQGGVAVFDDLTVDLPGRHSLSTGPAPLQDTRAAFTVVAAGTIPATLNRRLIGLEPGAAAGFAAGDALAIATRSEVSLAFRQASTLVPRGDAGELELLSGAAEVKARDLQALSLRVAGLTLQLSGSATVALSTGSGQSAVTVLDGSVTAIPAGPAGDAEIVPPGGVVLADAAGVRSTGLTLVQLPLAVGPTLLTRIALANPTTRSAAITLTARDQGGRLLGQARNPQTFSLAAGAVVHAEAAGLLGLAPGTGSVLGTLEVTADNLGVRGSAVVELLAEGVAIAEGLSGRQEREAVLLEEPARTFLLLHNPGAVALDLTLQRFDGQGQPAATRAVTVPARGLRVEPTETLFGPAPEAGVGRIVVSAAGPFLAGSAVLGVRSGIAFGGRGPVGAAATLRAPFVAELPGVAATTVTLVNGSDTVPVRLALRLRDAGGMLRGAAFELLQPGTRIERPLPGLFSELPPSGFSGWLEVSAIPTAAASDPVRLLGAVTLTDPRSARSVMLPLVADAGTDLTAPLVETAADLLTLVSVVNPSAEAPVTVTVIARGLDGAVAARVPLRVGPLAQSQAPLPADFVGSVQVTADAEIVAGGLSGTRDRRRLVPLFPP